MGVTMKGEGGHTQGLIFCGTCLRSDLLVGTEGRLLCLLTNPLQLIKSAGQPWTSSVYSLWTSTEFIACQMLVSFLCPWSGCVHVYVLKAWPQYDCSKDRSWQDMQTDSRLICWVPLLGVSALGPPISLCAQSICTFISSMSSRIYCVCQEDREKSMVFSWEINVVDLVLKER